MTELLSASIAGLGQGSIYALLALGFVIIYKAMGVISFAQPALMMTGAVMVSYWSPKLGFWPAVVLAGLAVTAVALVVERLAIRPMVGKAVFVIAIITIGVDIVVRVVTGMFIGTDALIVGDPWGLDRWNVGGVIIQQRHVAAFVAAAVIVALVAVFFRYTSIGLA
ncbi:MAG TPA: branched-chain amino acid ABC transporter permease, partial [Aeromicrobium sp.]|nr:branched-chain amino acid ABC transporter permease [Aeromicrobium sp.]